MELQFEIKVSKSRIKTLAGLVLNKSLLSIDRKDAYQELKREQIRLEGLEDMQLKVNTSRKGIYFIINSTSKRCYIGKSKNMHSRVKKHISEINNRYHHNPLLMEQYLNKETFVVYYVPTKKDNPLDVERDLMNYMSDNGFKLYNISIPRVNEEEYMKTYERYKKHLERVWELMHEGE